MPIGDTVFKLLEAATDQETRILCEALKIEYTGDRGVDKTTISRAYRSAAGSAIKKKVLRRKEHDFPYKQILIDVADKTKPGLRWTTYTLDDGATEEQVEATVNGFVLKRLEKKLAKLLPEERQKRAKEFDEELKRRGYPAAARGAVSGALAAGTLGALAATPAAIALFYGTLLGGLYAAIFGPALGLVIAAGAGIGTLVLLPIGIAILDTPAYRKTVPVTLQLIAIRKRLQAEAELKEVAMPIPFEVPAKFLASVVSGDVTRYGAILKDVASGQIVGHLKEVGGLVTGQPWTAVVSQLGQSAQLAHIQQTLESLQLVATVGTVASVAGLGVSVAGFIVVNRKLNQINGKLDTLVHQVACLKEAVDRLALRWDAMNEAALASAAQALTQGLAAETEDGRRRLLDDAAREFRLLHGFYHQLFMHTAPWRQLELPADTVWELYSRAVVCGLGRLEAEFLLGDWGAFHEAWLQVVANVREAAAFDPVEAYRARSDEANRHGYTTHTLTITPDLPKQLRAAHANAQETLARVETSEAEARFVRHLGISPRQYVDELRAHDTPDVLLLPWPDDLRRA